MTIVFSDVELQYIIKQQFNWHISKNCPKDLRRDIEKKLKMLSKKTYSYEEANNERINHKR